MKIVIATTEFPPYSGGVATFAEAAAKGLAELGDDVTVLAPDYRLNGTTVDNDQLFRVERVAVDDNGKSLRWRLLKCFVSQSPDCLLLANGKATRYVSPLGRLPIPYAIYLHGSEVLDHCDADQSRLHETVRSQVIDFYRRAECVVGNSASTVDQFNQYRNVHQQTADLVHLGIDLMRLPSVSDADRAIASGTSAAGRERIILCVSRLHPGKGHDVLLRALRQVVNEFPDARLHIAGDGRCRTELQALASELNLESFVRFFGDLTPKDLANQYDICELFAMVSRLHESFGLVFVEANAFGKPVVAGRTGGVADAVVDGVTGVLVDPLDQQAIANAVSLLLHDSELRRSMGEAGKQRVIEYFNHVRMATQLRERLAASDRSNRRLRTLYWSMRETAAKGLGAAIRTMRSPLGNASK